MFYSHHLVYLIIPSPPSPSAYQFSPAEKSSHQALQGHRLGRAGRYNRMGTHRTEAFVEGKDGVVCW
eukprot:757358-Hanusia_phi.AAC.2